MSEKIDRATKREFAKIGMTAALGIAVLTAPLLKRNRRLKNLHTGAGVALVALGLWHHFLYQPKKRKAGAAFPAAADESAREALPAPAADPAP
jgi:hypothetical protein